MSHSGLGCLAMTSEMEREYTEDITWVARTTIADCYHHFRPLTRRTGSPQTFPSGTSTVPPRTRPLVTTPTSTCALVPSSPILSAASPTSSSWLSAGCPMAPPTSTTSATSAPRSWRLMASTSPGSVSSRSTLCSTWTTGLSAGPPAVSLPRTYFPSRSNYSSSSRTLLTPSPGKDLTTAVSVPARSFSVTSSRLTTRLACMPV